MGVVFRWGNILPTKNNNNKKNRNFHPLPTCEGGGGRSEQKIKYTPHYTGLEWWFVDGRNWKESTEKKAIIESAFPNSELSFPRERKENPFFYRKIGIVNFCLSEMNSNLEFMERPIFKTSRLRNSSVCRKCLLAHPGIWTHNPERVVYTELLQYEGGGREWGR